MRLKGNIPRLMSRRLVCNCAEYHFRNVKPFGCKLNSKLNAKSNYKKNEVFSGSRREMQNRCWRLAKAPAAGSVRSHLSSAARSFVSRRPRCKFVSRARRRRALGVFNDNNYSIAARREMQKVAWSEGNLQPRLYTPSSRGIYCSSQIKKTHLMAKAQIFFVAIVKCVVGARG